MLSPEATLQGAAETDWIGVGLVLCAVGTFLLANALLLRPPRALVEELFGERGVRLHAIREYVFHRAQVSVGFAFLLLGFGVQLLGRHRPIPAPELRTFPAAWVGAVLVLAVALLWLAWWWASRSFRRHVRTHLLRHPPEFESRMELAREVGELFGVPPRADDTVRAYLERLHRTLDLPPPLRRRGGEIPLPREEDLETGG